MTLRLIATIILSITLSFSLQKEGDSIQWNATRKLNWDDFKSRPDSNATNAALTSSTINFRYNYDSDKGFSYTIGCLFEKNSSWVRVKTDYILSHEQGHFDITEIFARKLNQQIKAYKFKSSASAQKEVPAMYQKIMNDLVAMQNLYDNETDYSRNKAQQAAWLERIDKDLNKLEEFAGYK